MNTINTFIFKKFNFHSLKWVKPIILIPFLVVFVLLGTCVKPFEPNITKYDGVLVVDGEINNLPGPYEVKLTQSYKYEKDSGIKISGAVVKIIENTGGEISLQENGDGIYLSNSSFRAVIGNSYKLQITYNSEIYETEFEMIKEPVPIDTVYWEYRNSDNVQTDGIQLLLNTHDPGNNTHYYAWEYEETWKFYVPDFPSDKPEWEKCYKYSNSYYFKIASSTRLSSNRITRYPLLFIDENTNRLRWRYSILVKQFVLSEPAYKFYSDLIKLNESQGTLFDPTPHSLTGNVKCLTDKDKPVLGYFMVSGVSKKRIFIDNDDLPIEYQPVSGFESCFFEFLNIFRKNPFEHVVREISPILYSLCNEWDFNRFQNGDTILTIGIKESYPHPYLNFPDDTLYFPVVLMTEILGETDTLYTLMNTIPGSGSYDCSDWPFPTEIDISTDTDTIFLKNPAVNYQKSLRNYSAVDSMLNLGYIIYEVDTSVNEDTLFVIKFNKAPYCFNCTLSGDNKEPDFWIDE